MAMFFINKPLFALLNVLLERMYHFLQISVRFIWSWSALCRILIFLLIWELVVKVDELLLKVSVLLLLCLIFAFDVVVKHLLLFIVHGWRWSQLSGEIKPRIAALMVESCEVIKLIQLLLLQNWIIGEFLLFLIEIQILLGICGTCLWFKRIILNLVICQHGSFEIAWDSV